jgi:hypothetical protein
MTKKHMTKTMTKNMTKNMLKTNVKNDKCQKQLQTMTKMSKMTKT